MNRVWKKHEQYSNDIAAQLLAVRGIAGEEAGEAFLDPKYEHLHNPFLLRDMDKAAERIALALKREEKIIVYADYDADAVTAAAVLGRFFRMIGYPNFDFYIPDRFSEGYGVNPDAVEKLAAQNADLMITVDCGINAFEAAKKAKELGLDLVITDHHQLTPHPSEKGEGLTPDAVAVVDAHRPDDKYPFKDLTGVGVAFKLVQALISKLLTTNYSLPTTSFEKWLLDLVAIGTVADCQALLGENRNMVKWGLHVLGKTRWPGLRELLELAGISEKQKFSAYDLGFIIAPRINAAGRIEHAGIALDLLMTDDLHKAADLAAKLEQLNHHRQDVTAGVLSEAKEQIAVALDNKILLAAGENWPKGVVGLVAGKIAEEYHKPVLVMEKGGEEATGSARSIASFNIIEAIHSSRHLLIKYGGHPQAAGFTLKSEHIEEFHRTLISYADNALTPEMLDPVLHYDMDLDLEQINPDLLGLLEKFEPYGVGNPRPRFKIKDLRLKSLSAVGSEGKHLKLRLEAGNSEIGAIAFNFGFWEQKLQMGDEIDVICEPQYNEWNGSKTIQLKIIDIKQ